MARNFMICKLVSSLFELPLSTDSRNRLVLRGQVYIADYKDEGNTLKPHLPENKTVVVFKALVFECAWAPSFVHPCIIKLCLHHAHDKMYQALPLLSGESLGKRLDICM